ncbi:unnamed protein product [Strongylus vulgaris]|uniref:Transmembrane protein n=1 Tax=Strongylus vulgaris TaxID=40348 RepID=A0A3P7J6E9_STRVU|nr:unnamed protein product [Strongylus vulgaris]
MVVDESGTSAHGITLTERALSFLCAMISGLFYGTMWIPISYMRSHSHEYPNAPAESISYLFSFYCGVLCTAVCIFIVYSLIMRNKPWINPSGAVPTILGGIIFSIGMSAFVTAIDNLEQAIAYPICTMAPGLVVTSWSIFYFKEITVGPGLFPTQNISYYPLFRVDEI